MPKNPNLTVIEAALNQARGDDLVRARACFRGLTPQQMEEPWGQSGRTRADVLRDYEQRDAEIDQALAWVREKA